MSIMHSGFRTVTVRLTKHGEICSDLSENIAKLAPNVLSVKMLEDSQLEVSSSFLTAMRKVDLGAIIVQRKTFPLKRVECIPILLLKNVP